MKKKNYTQGAAFLIFAHCAKRILQFEKAISEVVCQTNVFMQLNWESTPMLFHMDCGPEAGAVRIQNVCYVLGES